LDIEQIGADGHPNDRSAGITGGTPGAHLDILNLVIAADRERHEITYVMPRNRLDQGVGRLNWLAIDGLNDVSDLQDALGRHAVDDALHFGTLTGDLNGETGGAQSDNRRDRFAFIDEALVFLVDLLLGSTGGPNLLGRHDFGVAGESGVGDLAPAGFRLVDGRERQVTVGLRYSSGMVSREPMS
jgi:hypothetical protein